MGTRSLIRIIKNKKTKVAQYCQWDGYPDGQGLGILRALRGIDKEKFSKQVDKCAFVPDKETNEIEWRRAYKYNNRDLGSDIINMILNDEDDIIYLFDNSSFSEDGLFCEYHWVIDLDFMNFGEADSDRFPISVLPSDENFLKYYEDLYSE